MKKSNLYDVVVVGSGPSGLHAAYPLIKTGLNVAIIDGGLNGNPNDVFAKTNQILKIQSNIKINQSLAKGGFSHVWPGICDYFSEKELIKIGLPPNELAKEYKEVSKLIKLDVKPALDLHGSLILKTNKNIYRLPIAHSYWTGSVIDDLKKFKNFEFIPDTLVTDIKDGKTFIKIQSLSIDNKTKIMYKSKFIILAAGLNTSRILLRSFNLYNYKIPFLTKGNYMFACLHPRILFNKTIFKAEKTSQVAISNSDYFVQFYKSNPSALEKALPYIPLPKKIASLLFKILTPFLVIADIRFGTSEDKSRFLQLKKSKTGNDILDISFHLTLGEIQTHKKHLNKIKKDLFRLGLIPLKLLNGDVTSHYANGVPISDIPRVLSTDQNGKLHQANRIYIADASTWQYLPAKPPTLTIMANARRIGKQVLENFH